MTSIDNVSFPNYILNPGYSGYVYINIDNASVKLPPYLTTNEPINVVNLSNTVCKILDNNIEIYEVPQKTTSIFLSDIFNFKWTLIGSYLNGNSGTSEFIKIDGTNSMIADLNIDNNKIINVGSPIALEDAANKAYVDTSVFSKLNINGSNTMTGNLNFGNNKGINLALPTLTTDAATKSYVDQPTNTSVSGTVTANWVRAYTISGTQGSTIDIYFQTRTTIALGSDFNTVHVELSRNGGTLYSVIVYPWADSTWVPNIAVNSTEIWFKRRTGDTGAGLIVQAYIRTLYTNTTLTKDGTTNQAADPTGTIDTSSGSAMYFINGNRQIKGVADPTLSDDVATKSYVDSVIVSSSLSPIIPLLIGNNFTDNNQAFGTSASSTGTSAEPYYPFSAGGPNYWTPNTLGNNSLAIDFPIPCLINAILISFRGSSGTEYFSGVKLQGANSPSFIYVDLHTIPDAFTQISNIYFSKFTNIVPYQYYRIVIASSITSDVNNLGILNMQLFGGY